jgi:hypothetical protein
VSAVVLSLALDTPITPICGAFQSVDVTVTDTGGQLEVPDKEEVPGSSPGSPTYRAPLRRGFRFPGPPTTRSPGQGIGQQASLAGLTVDSGSADDVRVGVSGVSDLRRIDGSVADDRELAAPGGQLPADGARPMSWRDALGVGIEA